MERNIITFKNLFDTNYTEELRNWRNQDFVREKMINQDIISIDQHKIYLERLAEDKETRKVFIAFDCDIPFGTVNFTICKEENYIEPAMYLINADYLGKGFGKILSFARLDYIFNVLPDGEMRTKILSFNATNLGLQQKMGAEIREKQIYNDENGIEREAIILYETKKMWERKRAVILNELKDRFHGIEINDIPN